MAKHEVILHENTGATKDKAPYLGGYVTKNTVKLADIVAAAAPSAGMPAIKMQTLIENDIEALTALEKQGACRIHLDGGYIELRILGSFESSDASWDSGKNKLIVAFTPDADLRNSLVNETCKIVTDETSTKVRLDNVFDVAKPKPTEIIYGRGVFQLQGINLCLEDEDARVELVSEVGVIFPCVVVETLNRQNVRVKTASLLEDGDYKVVVYSRGGDAEGDLQSSFRKVKYIRVEEPVVIDKIASEGKDGIVKGEAFAATGSGLRFDAAAGDKVTVKWTQDGEEKTLEVTPTATEPTKMDFDAVDAFEAIPDNTELTFEFELGSETAEGETTVIGA